MAKSLSSLTVVTKLVIAAEPWNIDPQVPPIPWRENIFQDLSKRPLVVGTMLDDGAVRVHPPIERLFRELVTRLKAAGHVVVDWDSSLNSTCIEIMVRAPVPNPVSASRPYPKTDQERPGRILCRGWRRGYSKSRCRRWRALRSADSSIRRSRSTNLGLPILATEQGEGCNSTGLSRYVGQHTVSVGTTCGCTPCPYHATHGGTSWILPLDWVHQAVQYSGLYGFDLPSRNGQR